MILPLGINLSNWAASLFIDFSENDIPMLLDETDWKSWGNRLVQSEAFFLNNAPSPISYNDWQSWATAVFYVMNNSNADNFNTNEDENV